MIKSHIQLPKWIMKNFMDEKTGRIPYINVTEPKIGQCGIMKLGVQEDYYSADGEGFLCSEIEKPLSKLRDKVIAFVNGTSQTLELPIEDEQLLRQYCFSAISRSKSALHILHTHSAFSQFASPQTIHDLLIYAGHELANADENFLHNNILGVYINQTDREFVVPRNCFYTILQENVHCIVMPITPTIAFGLFPPQFVEHRPYFEQYRIQIVNNASVVEIMNERALLYEYAVNSEFVIGRQRDELERLKQVLCDHKNDFDKVKQLFYKTDVSDR